MELESVGASAGEVGSEVPDGSGFGVEDLAALGVVGTVVDLVAEGLAQAAAAAGASVAAVVGRALAAEAGNGKLGFAGGEGVTFGARDGGFGIVAGEGRGVADVDGLAGQLAVAVESKETSAVVDRLVVSWILGSVALRVLVALVSALSGCVVADASVSFESILASAVVAADRVCTLRVQVALVKVTLVLVLATDEFSVVRISLY